MSSEYPDVAESVLDGRDLGQRGAGRCAVAGRADGHPGERLVLLGAGVARAGAVEDGAVAVEVDEAEEDEGPEAGAAPLAAGPARRAAAHRTMSSTMAAVRGVSTTANATMWLHAPPSDAGDPPGVGPAPLRPQMKSPIGSHPSCCRACCRRCGARTRS